MISVPVARALALQLALNWQNVDVRPDYEIASDEAFDIAYRLVLEELLASSEEPIAHSEQEYALRLLAD